MGRSPCCDKASVKKGPWSPEEDAKLKEFIEKFGTGGNWIALPQKAGLKRCGKSCRLRWLNYLRPNIRHGEFSDDEDRIICTLYASIGSRWSVIAAQLPGRTDNDIKNYWNTKLKKKLFTSSQQLLQEKPQTFFPSSLPIQPPYDHHLINTPSSSCYPYINPPNFMNIDNINSNSLFVHDHNNNIVTHLSPPPPASNLMMSNNIHNIDDVNDSCYSYLGFQEGMVMFGSTTTGCSSEGGSGSCMSQISHAGNYNKDDNEQKQNYQIKQEDYQIISTTLHDHVNDFGDDQIQTQSSSSSSFMIKNQHVTAPLMHINDDHLKQLNFSSYLFHEAGDDENKTTKHYDQRGMCSYYNY